VKDGDDIYDGAGFPEDEQIWKAPKQGTPRPVGRDGELLGVFADPQDRNSQRFTKRGNDLGRVRFLPG